MRALTPSPSRAKMDPIDRPARPGGVTKSGHFPSRVGSRRVVDSRSPEILRIVFKTMAEKAKRHVHKYRIKTLAHVKVWACALPDCYHYIPPSMGQEWVEDKSSICWDCGQKFQLDAIALQEERPRCFDCRHPELRDVDLGIGDMNANGTPFVPLPKMSEEQRERIRQEEIELLKRLRPNIIEDEINKS